MRLGGLAFLGLMLAGCQADERAVLTTVGAAGPTGPQVYRGEIQGIVDELAKHAFVDEAMGVAAEPGKFPAMRARLEKMVTFNDCWRMMRDSRVVVRVMGMNLLSRRYKERAAELILTRARSVERVATEFGCVGGSTTEGNLALGELYMQELLSKRQEAALSLMACTWDEQTDYEVRSGGELEKRILDGTFVYEMGALRDLCGGMPDVLIIKAIGRMGLPPVMNQNDFFGPRLEDSEKEELRAKEKKDEARMAAARRNFLIRCLEDSGLTIESRLAAGSGLTRDGHEDAGAALERNREWLDRHGEGNKLGTRFVNEWRERRILDAAGLPRYRETWFPKEGTDVLALCKHVHPMYLQLLESAGGSAEVTAAARRTVIELAGRLGEYQAVWDTYSDAGYWLAEIVNQESIYEWEAMFGPLTKRDKREMLWAIIGPKIRRWVPEFDLLAPDPDLQAPPWGDG